MRVGFIGTGTMGNPMSRCLIEAGYDVVVNDLRREAAANLIDRGAKWGDSPRAVAAASEVVFTSLPGPKEMEQVVLDPENGILAGLRPGGAYIDVTTNSPDVFRRVAEVCRTRGVEVLDAPVSGRPPEMTMMVGGDAATFAKYRPVLECMAKYIFHVGESGTGCIAKLVTQYMGYSNFIAAAEGFIIAAKAGIDIRVLAELAPVTVAASRHLGVFPREVFKGNFSGAGSLDIVAKDLMLACELARKVQAPASIGIIAEDVFKRGQAQGWGQTPFHSAVRVLEEMAGIELRAPEE